MSGDENLSGELTERLAQSSRPEAPPVLQRLAGEAGVCFNGKAP